MADTHVSPSPTASPTTRASLYPNGNLVANFRLAVTARVGEEAGATATSTTSTSTCGGSWPSTSPTLCPRATGRWSSAGSSPQLGDPRGDKRSVVEVEADESPPRCAGPPPSPNAPPTARARAAISTTPRSWRGVRPGRMRPASGLVHHELEESLRMHQTLPDHSILSWPCTCWTGIWIARTAPRLPAHQRPRTQPRCSAGPPVASERSSPRAADGQGHHPPRHPRTPGGQDQQATPAGRAGHRGPGVPRRHLPRRPAPPPCAPWPTRSPRPPTWPTPTTPTPTPSPRASRPTATSTADR